MDCKCHLRLSRQCEEQGSCRESSGADSGPLPGRPGFQLKCTENRMRKPRKWPEMLIDSTVGRTVSFELVLPFLRPIEPLLLDESISEIMGNPDASWWYEREGILYRASSVSFAAGPLRTG